MPSNFPYIILEDLLKTNWSLPEIAVDKIDWGYYPESIGSGANLYTIKCDDGSERDVDHYGVPLTHMHVANSIGIVIGVRSVTADKTRPPSEYIKIVNHIRDIIKANRFSDDEIQEFRLARGSREIENRMIGNSRWFIYVINVDAFFWG